MGRHSSCRLEARWPCRSARGLGSGASVPAYLPHHPPTIFLCAICEHSIAGLPARWRLQSVRYAIQLVGCKGLLPNHPAYWESQFHVGQGHRYCLEYCEFAVSLNLATLLEKCRLDDQELTPLQVVGRGGQTLVVWASWRVFQDFVALSLLTHPVAYSTFFIVFIQKAPSLKAVYRTIRDLTSSNGLRSKLAMYFIVATMMFCLAFPTFATSMAGYTTANKAFVEQEDGGLTGFADVMPVAYIIHDGSRINQTDELIVSLLCEGMHGCQKEQLPGHSR